MLHGDKADVDEGISIIAVQIPHISLLVSRPSEEAGKEAGGESAQQKPRRIEQRADGLRVGDLAGPDLLERFR
jgi:hypothetical protein